MYHLRNLTVYFSVLKVVTIFALKFAERTKRTYIGCFDVSARSVIQCIKRTEELIYQLSHNEMKLSTGKARYCWLTKQEDTFNKLD